MSNGDPPDWYTQAMMGGGLGAYINAVQYNNAQQSALLAQHQNALNAMYAQGLAGFTQAYVPKFDPTWKMRYELALTEARTLRFAGEM